MTKPVHVMSHSSCPDGFGAAFVAHQALSDRHSIVHHPMAYDDPLPDDIDGCFCYVLDFCFPPDQLAELVRRAEGVVVLDHHQTAEGWLEEAAGRGILTLYGTIDDWGDAGDFPYNLAVLNQNKSGVGLAQEWFDLHWPMMDHLEDRDLWRFALPGTADVFAAVTSRPYDLDVWEWMVNQPIEVLKTEGEAINRYRDQLIDTAVASAWMISLPQVGEVPIAPCAYAIGSDVAGKLAEQHHSGMGMYFVAKHSSVRLGFRSRNDGPDVAKIAGLWGGGGHRAAAGAQVSWDEFHSWR